MNAPLTFEERNWAWLDAAMEFEREQNKAMQELAKPSATHMGYPALCGNHGDYSDDIEQVNCQTCLQQYHINTMPTSKPRPIETVQDIIARERKVSPIAAPYPHIHPKKPKKYPMALHMKALYGTIACILALPFVITIAFLMWMHSVSTTLETISHDLAYMDMSLTYISEEMAMAKEGYQQTIAFDLK